MNTALLTAAPQFPGKPLRTADKWNGGMPPAGGVDCLQRGTLRLPTLQEQMKRAKVNTLVKTVKDCRNSPFSQTKRNLETKT